MERPPYKPSPLSFGSPRASPFRRPESPASPSPLRPSTPAVPPSKVAPALSPSKPITPLSSPSKLNGIPIPSHHQSPSTPVSNTGSWTPRVPNMSSSQQSTPSESPTKGATIAAATAMHNDSHPPSSATSRTVTQQPSSNNGPRKTTVGPGDAISKLPTNQVREMRETFEILDQDNDMQVTREDVAHILTNLGQEDTSHSTLTSYFPPGASNPLPLSVFLSSLANPLTQLSSQSELASALSAFDDDDSGQIDIGELKDALMNTNTEPGSLNRARPLSEREVDMCIEGFQGRREFGKRGLGAHGKKGDVFRYEDFMREIYGSRDNVQVKA